MSGKAENEDGLAPIKDENADGRRPALRRRAGVEPAYLKQEKGMVIV